MTRTSAQSLEAFVITTREPLLAAKATVLIGLTLAVGTVAVLGSMLAAQLIMPGHGYNPARGHPAVSLADQPLLRAAARSVSASP